MTKTYNQAVIRNYSATTKYYIIKSDTFHFLLLKAYHFRDVKYYPILHDKAQAKEIK